MVRNSDLKIIRILQENSRTPFLRIAKALGVSEAAVRKRVKKLEREGVIKRYTVEVDPVKLGFEIVAFIGVDTRPEYYISTLEKLKDLDKVVSLYSSSGDHMILLECWFKDSEELAEFVKRLNSMDGVTRVCPAIILKKLK
ncbi:transcriptional regulator [Candidatus Bathyarchaeota archaeon]|nr:MAG: transcriptional regulator [Candidatus Bathyarchaeota archaeon]